MNPTEIIHCAHAIEEAVRRLTHLTLTAPGDLRDSYGVRDEFVSPADIDTLLAHLAEAMAGLPQVATQIAGLLENERNFHRLEMDGMTDTTAPDLALDTALLHLDALRHPAVLVHRRLNAARAETAHIRADPGYAAPRDGSVSVERLRTEGTSRNTDLDRKGPTR